MFTLLAAKLVLLEAGKALPPKAKLRLMCLDFSLDFSFVVEAWAVRYEKDFASNPPFTFYEVLVIGGMGIPGNSLIFPGELLPPLSS